MTSHFKGRYKLLAPVDLSTNDFPKTLNGTNEEIDIYIQCKYDGQISYYGKSILMYYIPHLHRGNSIIRQIYALYINPDNVETIKSRIRKRDGSYGEKTNYRIIDEDLFHSDLKSDKNIIFNVETTDSEVVFRFKYSNSEKIIPLLSPLTSGCNRSPFSVKNLPKTNYTIPEEDLNLLKNKTEIYPNFNNVDIGHITKKFIQKLSNKKKKDDSVKADMRKKGLSGQKYIHSIGKWKEFLRFADCELKNKYGTENK